MLQDCLQQLHAAVEVIQEAGETVTLPLASLPGAQFFGPVFEEALQLGRPQSSQQVARHEPNPHVCHTLSQAPPARPLRPQRRGEAMPQHL